MIEIRKTETFRSWIKKLKDRRARALINIRIDRIRSGNFVKAAPVGEGVSELKISYGPGYRIYFVQRGKTVVILLLGGDKSSQASDIKKAKAIARQLSQE